MSGFPFLPLSTDAYLADTRHLSAEEHGAYMLLLMMAWRTPECRLPDDDVKLARWASVTPKVWRRIRPTIMAFWTLENGQWSQKRLSQERDFVSRRANVSRSNGERGGRPKSLKNNEPANPAGNLEETRSITTSTSTKKTPMSPSGTKAATRKRDAGYGDASDPLFADFNTNIWAKRWQRPNNNPLEAFRAYAKLTENERAACKAGIERSSRAIVADSSEAKFRPMLATWINKRGWEADGRDVVTEAKPVDWVTRVGYFRETGEWPVGWGSRPGDPGCKAPRELLIGATAA